MSSPRTRELVIDACSTLNLLATRRELEIVGALGLQLLDTPQVSREAMTLWTPPDDDGQRNKKEVSTESLRRAGHLEARANRDRGARPQKHAKRNAAAA